MNAEESGRRQRFCPFILFSIPVPVQVRIYKTAHLKINAWIEIKLPVSDSDLRADLALTDAIKLRFSSWDSGKW